MISTKGRYAVRVLVDLAQHAGDAPVPLKDVAARQDLSLKYLERILPDLMKARLVLGSRGKGGGYRLARNPGDVTVWEVLLAAEGEMAPVACLESNAADCPRKSFCPTLPLWKGYFEVTRDYFSGFTLQDLLGADPADQYVI